MTTDKNKDVPAYTVSSETTEIGGVENDRARPFSIEAVVAGLSDENLTLKACAEAGEKLGLDRETLTRFTSITLGKRLALAACLSDTFPTK